MNFKINSEFKCNGLHEWKKVILDIRMTAISQLVQMAITEGVSKREASKLMDMDRSNFLRLIRQINKWKSEKQ